MLMRGIAVKLFAALCFVLFIGAGISFSQTTGKIAGSVTDAETGEPLPGVNVFIQGTDLGAATDADGDYFIIQVPPGTYTVVARFIGYAEQRKTGAQVNIDRTLELDFSLQPSAIAGEEVTVTAERNVVRKDVSHSVSEISEQEATGTAAVSNLQDLVLLQPGVEMGGGYMSDDSRAYREGISIRGGQVEETDFRIDGLSVKDARAGIQSNKVSLTSVQEIQVIRGGFNAEYGDIRSGLVNVVTKDAISGQGGRQFNVSAIVEYTPERLGHWGENYYSYDNERSVLYPYLGPESMGGYSYTYPDGETVEVWQGWEDYANNLPEDHPYYQDPESAREQFAWESRPQPYGDDPDYNIDATITGPIPLLDNASFMLTHINQQMDIPYNSPVETHNDNSTYLKMMLRPTSNLKVTLGGQYGEMHTISSAYRGVRPGSYWLIEDQSHWFSLNNHFWNQGSHTPTDHFRRRYMAKATYTFNQASYLQFEVNHQANNYYANHMALRDLSAVKTIETENGQTVELDNRPFGYFGEYKVKNVLGYYVAGHGTRRDNSWVKSTTMKADNVNQFNKYNQVKFGVEWNYDDINNQWGQHRKEKGLKREWFYHVQPWMLSTYLQDKLEFEGMIANIGVRVDYSDPADEWFNQDDPFSSWFERGKRQYTDNSFPGEADYTQESRIDSFQYAPMSDVQPKMAISPRIGISHPIGAHSKLFFNYGHFYQRPASDRMFRQYWSGVTQLELNEYGNPNLDFTKTVAFELGAEQDILNQINIRVTGYYKDISNELIWIDYNGIGSIDYDSPENNGYRDIRGIELEVRKRAGRFITGYLSYDYRIMS
ncbi:MAG: TonB-dependent receptor plug domain-containing protein, partial [Candidatus Marinimicrobia bacterium]|nr:TonB-dependent receptor plug domain-containing protein [Candidatus Neomarinimicrobiota bacterium]